MKVTWKTRLNAPIRTRIIAYSTFLIGSLTLFLFFYLPIQIEKQAMSYMAFYTHNVAQMIAFSSSPGIVFEDQAAVEEALHVVEQSKDLRYGIIKDRNQRVLAAFRPEVAQKNMSAPVQNLASALAADSAIYSVQAPVLADGVRIGTVYLGFSLQPVHDRIDDSRKTLAGICLLVFVLAVSASVLFSLIITRPLSQITRTVDRISQGDVRQRAPENTRNEIGTLARSFNRMVDRLEASYRELETVNLALETRVLERTRELQASNEQLNRELNERERIEKALRLSEEKYRDLFEHTHDLIQFTSPTGAYLYVNEAWSRTLGYRSDRVEVLTFQDIVFPEDRELVARILEKARQNRSVETALFNLVAADGRLVQIMGSISFRFENDQPLGVRGIFHDITEQKKFEQGLIEAKEKAEELVRVKDVFVANMSHELRTPLTAIIGSAQILCEETQGLLRDFAVMINDGAHRLLQTINSILTFSRLEANHISHSREDIDLIRITRDTVVLLTPLATAKNITLELRETVGELYTSGDKQGYESILSNLIGNAIKFTDAGYVRVGIGVDQSHVVIRVEDTGIGISPEFMPYLFQEFEQESTGLTRTHEGSGLGLAITHRLVDSMDGTITVESEKFRGTTFTVRIPLVESSGEPVALIREHQAG